jgi:hypothetical protein
MIQAKGTYLEIGRTLMRNQLILVKMTLLDLQPYIPMNNKLSATFANFYKHYARVIKTASRIYSAMSTPLRSL